MENPIPCRVYSCSHDHGEREFLTSPGYLIDNMIYAADDGSRLKDADPPKTHRVYEGQCLYTLPEYIAPAACEYYDIATYQIGELYGFVSTKSGQIITGAQFSDVDAFYNKKYTEICFPDGRSGIVAAAGELMQPEGYDDVCGYHDGVYIVRKRIAKLSHNNRLVQGAVDREGKILVDFQWDALRYGMEGWAGYIARCFGVYQFLNVQGKVHGSAFYTSCPQFIRGAKDYWLVERHKRYGIMRTDGAFVFEPTLSRRAAQAFLDKFKK